MSIINDIVYQQAGIKDVFDDEGGCTAMNTIGAYNYGSACYTSNPEHVVYSNEEDNNGVVLPWSGSMTTATETPGLESMKKYEPTYKLPITSSYGGQYINGAYEKEFVVLNYQPSGSTTSVSISPEAFNVTANQIASSTYVAAPELDDIILVYFNPYNPTYGKKYIALKCTTVGNVATSTEEGGSQSANDYVFSYVASQQQLPVCLTDTCDILTPNGYVNVKDLSVGDLVTTPEGKDVKITKVMKPTTHFAMGKALPHFIPKNSLGENKPTKDTFISKNHAYKSGDEWLCSQFNIEHNAINWDQNFVTYYNVMTEDYPKHSLVVNGVEMESWGGYEHNKPETHGNIKLRKEKLAFK